jgi:hypothetical protein
LKQHDHDEANNCPKYQILSERIQGTGSEDIELTP